MDDVRPKLRAVEAFPLDLDGRKVICLRDPENYATGALCVPMGAADILRLFDGCNSIIDIQARHAQRSGEILYREVIEQMIATLDENLFLDSERFREHRKAALEEWYHADVRSAFCAGRSYPNDPGELRQLLDGILGSAGNTRDNASEVAKAKAPTDTPIGVVAPHIDYQRGAAGYAEAYRALAVDNDADLFVILGTSHTGLDQLYSPCRKDFATPLGRVATDHDFIDRLMASATAAVGLDDPGHRTEHSIEFQVVLLQHLFGSRRPFRIVPILCASLHEWVASRESPRSDEPVRSFLAALKDHIEANGRRVRVIAAADFAHVGPRFGDVDPVSPEQLSAIERDDRAMLESIVRGDAEKFFASVANDGDRRRVCGLAPIYAFLSLVDGKPGRLLHYGAWPDPAGLVTFGSVAF